MEDFSLKFPEEQEPTPSYISQEFSILGTVGAVRNTRDSSPS